MLGTPPKAFPFRGQSPPFLTTAWETYELERKIHRCWFMFWCHGCRVISNFAFSFAIISILTGITTLFNTGLTYGGTISMVYGWLIVGFFTMFVGLAMGEICSAFPTSGGLYYWSSQLAGPEWGPFASWITGWYAISHASKRIVLQLCHCVVFSFVIVSVWERIRYVGIMWSFLLDLIYIWVVHGKACS